MITATNLLTAVNGADQSSYTTASISPVANKFTLLCVYNDCSTTTNSNVPTVSGGGLTWTQVRTEVQATGAGSQSVRNTIFRGVSASPTSGAITIDFAGQTQIGCMWIVDQFTGVDTSDSGANAIVQSAVTKTPNQSQNSTTVTLSTFANTNNATYGIIGWGDAAGDLVAGSGFTQLGYTASYVTYQSQYKSTNDTTVDWTYGTHNNNVVAIAMELKAVISSGAGVFAFL